MKPRSQYRKHPGLRPIPNPLWEAYILELPTGVTAQVVISSDLGWDHVSVSIPGEARCPTWEEMCAVKDAFFHEQETVLQFHPPKSDYVNLHPFTLHLWKPQRVEIPLPAKEMV